MGSVKKIHITFLLFKIPGIARVLWPTFMLNTILSLHFDH